MVLLANLMAGCRRAGGRFRRLPEDDILSPDASVGSPPSPADPAIFHLFATSTGLKHTSGSADAGQRCRCFSVRAACKIPRSSGGCAPFLILHIMF